MRICLLPQVGSMLLSQDHTSAAGILALTVCITAAAGYQQAPLRGAGREEAGGMVGIPQQEPDIPSAEAAGVEDSRRASTGGVSIEMQGRANRV